MDLVKILGDFFEKEGSRCYVYGADDEGFLVSAIVNPRKIDSEVLGPGKCSLTEYVFIMKAREVLQKLLDNGAHILMNGRHYYIVESETCYFRDAPLYLKAVCRKEGCG
ncbi:hypothetical protein FACS189481_5410 [Clostridia bacterium]|nr:hypothetical protein FACS189481_5410 [Clostridia bacterium]